MFKFMDGSWKELQTTYTSEDTNNYYYEVNLNSFSFFVIGEKTKVASEPPAPTPPTTSEETPEETGEEEGKGNLGLIITIIVIIIVVVLISWFYYRRKM